MIALFALGCAEGPRPVLVAINDATYAYDLSGELSSFYGVNVEHGQTLPITVRARHTVDIRFANLPGILTFDPSGTQGTLEVFDGIVDTGNGFLDSIVTLTSAQGTSRDFPISFAFPSGDTGSGDSTSSE